MFIQISRSCLANLNMYIMTVLSVHVANVHWEMLGICSGCTIELSLSGRFQETPSLVISGLGAAIAANTFSQLTWKMSLVHLNLSHCSNSKTMVCNAI